MSPAMRETMGLIERYASADLTVAITGETGTGKDVVAHTIHQLSSRARGQFVVFDCGAIAANLAESELLGHERGSFTGAVTSHPGAFERAHGGTLFLDEIGEMPADLQPRLLRALENRSARRVGGTAERSFDVRVIAATNRDLKAEVAAGRFRADVYFRLCAAEIPIPSLRERIEDLPALAERLLNDIGRGDLQVPAETLEILRSHSWPGNVRELKNTLACAAAFVDRGHHELEPQHLRAVLRIEESGGGDLDSLPLGGRKLEAIEQAAIIQTLARAEGNKVKAAQLLGIAVSTLYEKLKKYKT